MIRRDTLLNLGGQGLPLVVALFTVPATVAGLGVERFGLLALAWTVLGSFNVVDVALGRAVTRTAAAALEQGERERIPALVWNAALLQAALGGFAAVLLAAAAPLLAGRVLDVPGPLAAEARSAFLVLALSPPLTLVMGVFRSLLEALRRFDLVNLVRAPSGAATFAIPWLGAVQGWGLPAIFGVLVAVRAGVALAYFLGCRPTLTGLPKPGLDRGVLGPLVRFGGWVTASNLIPPFLVLLERFLLGALISLEAVSLFSVPYEMVFRLWILPTSVVAALFPVLAAASGRQEWGRVRELGSRTAWTSLLLLAIPVLVLVAAAEPLLRLWIGGPFAEDAAPILRLLAVGFLASALASVSATVLQALGRPDRTARLRLLNLPLFAVLSWWTISRWGLTGAALSTVLRAVLDAALLHRAVREELNGKPGIPESRPVLPAEHR